LTDKKNIAALEKSKKVQLLFKGNVFKLHGDMEHENRKINFFGFDKTNKDESKNSEGRLLVCTDVASRGLDFKNVAWII
jgi:superfamily II DNA/RNA helicase